MQPIDKQLTLEEKKACTREYGNGMKFLHVRSHMRVPSPATGGVTLAYFTPFKGTVIVAAAFCSRKDVYCKATGRYVAAFKFNNGDGFRLRVPKNTDVRHVLKAMFIHCV